MPTYHMVHEVKTGFYLSLNSMRGYPEESTQFGPYDTAEAARAVYEAERVEPYYDTAPGIYDWRPYSYRKVFRKDGPFEWVNELTEPQWTTPGCYGHGFRELVESSIQLSCIQQP